MSDKYTAFFGKIKSFSNAVMKKLLTEYATEEEIYFNLDVETARRLALTENQINEYKSCRNKYTPEELWDELQAGDIKLMSRHERGFPLRLLNIPSSPYCLYYRGELPLDTKPSVAVIGARMCSEYGKSVAEYFGRELGKCDIQIISGLASGIDGISQRAALISGGKSYAVLGCGADICYPASNRRIYNELLEKGGIISELPPKSEPVAENFPRRNRIISGLADIVLVVEAKEKSGSAITVNMALEQGRSVYAVPGRINDALSAGCNRIISEGGGMAVSAEKILEELNMIKNANSVIMISDKSRLCENSMQRRLYEMLDTPHYLDNIYNEMAGNDDIESIKVELFRMVMNGILSEKCGLYEKI